jgi:predicted DNA-binding transcriptional regulator
MAKQAIAQTLRNVELLMKELVFTEVVIVFALMLFKTGIRVGEILRKMGLASVH